MRSKIIFCLLFSLFKISDGFSQTHLAQAKPAEKDEWGYIDPKGNFVIQPVYTKCFAFSRDGWAPVYDKKRKEFFFINVKGEELKTDVKGFELMNVFGFGTKGFQEGFVPVEINKKWGFMNTGGKLTIPAKYDKVEEFNGGFAIGKINENYLIVDREGKEIPIKANVVAVKHFSEGLAPFESADKNFGFIDGSGNVVIQPKFKSVGYFSDGLAWAKTSDGKVGYIGKNGDWFIQPQYEAAKEFGPQSNLARVKQGDKWMFVDKEGKIMSLSDAASTGDFSEGLCWGKKGDKVGFFDVTGRWVIEPKFDAVRDFKNGYAAVKTGDKWGFIDRTGSWAVNPIFDSVKDMEVIDYR